MRLSQQQLSLDTWETIVIRWKSRFKKKKTNKNTGNCGKGGGSGSLGCAPVPEGWGLGRECPLNLCHPLFIWWLKGTFNPLLCLLPAEETTGRREISDHTRTAAEGQREEKRAGEGRALRYSMGKEMGFSLAGRETEACVVMDAAFRAPCGGTS